MFFIEVVYFSKLSEYQLMVHMVYLRREAYGQGGGEEGRRGRGKHRKGGGEVELKASIPQFCLYIRI